MKTSVLRSIASSLLSLVVVATFLWGGCVSCEQYFMFPGKHQPCCNKSGQCERPGKDTPRPVKQDCNRLPLERTVRMHVPLPAAVQVPIAPPLEQFAASMFHRLALEDPSPPDAQALHATFLI